MASGFPIFFHFLCVCKTAVCPLSAFTWARIKRGEGKKKHRQTDRKKTNKEYKEVQFVRKYAGGNLDGIKEEKYVYVRGKLTHSHTHIYI